MCTHTHTHVNLCHVQVCSAKKELPALVTHCTPALSSRAGSLKRAIDLVGMPPMTMQLTFSVLTFDCRERIKKSKCNVHRESRTFCMVKTKAVAAFEQL